MRQLALFVLLSTYALGVHGQNTLEDAYVIFKNGKYIEAKQKYEQYNLTDGTDFQATYRIDHCNKCMQILPIADSLYILGDLENARKEYEKILAMNPFDPYVNNQVYYDRALEIKATQIGGILLNGVIWSKYNIAEPGTFTKRPEAAGMFFQWNRRKGWSVKEREIKDWDESVPSGKNWDEVNNPCPEGWRLPTSKELELLVYAHYQKANLNGIDGCHFGKEGNSIFLPCAGQREYGILFHSKFWGFYWSCSPFSTYSAMSLHFSYTGDIGWGSENLTHGFSVRCVAK